MRERRSIAVCISSPPGGRRRAFHPLQPPAKVALGEQRRRGEPARRGPNPGLAFFVSLGPGVGRADRLIAFRDRHCVRRARKVQQQPPSQPA